MEPKPTVITDDMELIDEVPSEPTDYQGPLPATGEAETTDKE